jgi:hypothetical protein
VLIGKFITSPQLRIAVSAGAACAALFWFVQRAALVPWT